MRKRYTCNELFSVASIIRRVLASWLLAATVEFYILPDTVKQLQDTVFLAEMSLLRLILITTVSFVLLSFWNNAKIERWSLVVSFTVLFAVSLYSTFTVPFLLVNGLILLVLIIYALLGWDQSSCEPTAPPEHQPVWLWITVAASVIFFLFVSIWTVSRVLTFSTPTYDFGIFSQMFYNMKATGLPMTTVERDGLLSHFHVHVSPIYYLLLPVYCLFPYPATLQILQAVILASAVIPLWLIGKHHKLHPAVRSLLCILLLLYPAYSGGTSYDIHENAFLTPLLLWLFYCFDKRSIPLTIVSAIFVLMVKEDAAVYVAIIALYYVVHGLLLKNRFESRVGSALFILAVIWFAAVTHFLDRVGDGVMTYRYRNFMFNESSSLLTVIKAVFLCPMKAIFECVDPEKLKFIAYTLLPVASLCVFTRKYERYLLLIPYILVNLMSDYQYQHDIFFQYTFGSTACLFYMAAVNLADFKLDFKRFTALAASICISGICFFSTVVPKAVPYPKKYIRNADSYAETQSILSLIPDDASVSATTFYTTFLSQRAVLYDIRYASDSHILSTEYVVLSVNADNFEEVKNLLEINGYSIFATQEGTLLIYRKM